MGKYPMTDVIASREYVLVRGSDRVPIHVEIGKPTVAPDLPGDWYCPWRLQRAGETRVSHAVGIDSVQAILLCFSGLRATLQQIAGTGKLLSTDGSEGLHIELVG